MATESAPKRALPKRAIEAVHLGQSFAEYDTMLKKSDVFVHTPALNAAGDHNNPHCFFVGRRGTGKTTITRFLEQSYSDVSLIRPEIFSPTGSHLDLTDFRDAKQRPFRSLTAAFRRTLQDEAYFAWRSGKGSAQSVSPLLAEEYNKFEDFDFDLRALHFIEELTSLLAADDEPAWVTAIKLPKMLGKELSEVTDERRPWTVLVDAIDESWDGSEFAVIYLAAMMHACLEINSQDTGLRVLLFLRENIFERVRVIDTEFARLETCVVGLDWSEEQLLEMVERRLNAALTTKFPLGGETWDLFFDAGNTARSLVFDYCQSRPRDVLTYCALALSTAQSHKHDRILISDLLDARRRFSDSRLNDLGDEYQENYPQIAVVLRKFYGLGRRWTLAGIAALLQRLLDDGEIKSLCANWIYTVASPEQFVRLLYEIGFFGLLVPRRDGEKRTVFRSLGPRDTTPPPIDGRTDISVHPSYWDALDLVDALVTEFGPDNQFGTLGVVNDFPGAQNAEQYRENLDALNSELKGLKTGPEAASFFEDLVGQVVELCFFRVLYNVESQSRDVAGTIRRDWVASNRGETGFWEMVRHQYGASQVIFECKNYAKLDASDFHQASYYMSTQAGKLVVIVFRGEVLNHYYDHLRKISTKDGGAVIMLNDKDLRVFVRQAMNGRVKDAHLMDKHDKLVRAIS